MALTITFSSCAKNELLKPQFPISGDVLVRTTQAVSITFNENFEAGSKTSYATGNVTFNSGSWTLNDALVGTSTSDSKTGTKSVRIRNTGILGMNFNVTTGASTVNIKHALYGSDGSCTWELWMSANSGSSYTKLGSTITSSSTTLQTATFNVNTSGNLRFQVRKISGGTNRINIDDFVVNSYDTTSGGGGSASDGDNMLLGNPSGAIANIGAPSNYLMNETYYIESYNRDRGTPNWVSWYVGTSSLGSAARQDDFRANPALPSGWYQVGSTSYSGSGFDRGHNCPSADRTSTITANSATFLMTNMIPQAPRNNQQTWGNMEGYIRSLVTAGNEVYVIMGSYGTGGTGSAGSANTINNGNVTVPSNVWKVVVVIPNGTGDLSRITSSTRVIAVNTPNINTISTDWKAYRTSVNAIEAATGYDLLSNVSTAIQSVIEAQVDNL